MVLDEVVWNVGVGGEVAIFVVWFWVGGGDDTHWDAVGEAMGGFDGCGDAGHTTISVDVQ